MLASENDSGREAVNQECKVFMHEESVIDRMLVSNNEGRREFNRMANNDLVGARSGELEMIC